MRWLTSLWSGVKWARRARVAAVQRSQGRAATGDPAAQFNLGERYHDGLGVPRDYEEALKWFLRSAEQGHAKARLNAGMMLFLGRGSAPDGAEAVKWLVLADEGGEAKARAALETMSKRLAPEVVEAGRRRAIAYKRTMTRP
jgi:uncharacterized protein